MENQRNQLVWRLQEKEGRGEEQKIVGGMMQEEEMAEQVTRCGEGEMSGGGTRETVIKAYSTSPLLPASFPTLHLACAILPYLSFSHHLPSTCLTIVTLWSILQDSQ